MKAKSKLPILLIALLALTNCSSDKSSDAKIKSSGQIIFPQGEPGPSANFTGNAYNYGLVPNDSVFNTLVGNVYF